MRLAALGLMLLTGCARNAILELEVLLPPEGGEGIYGQVELNVDDLGETPFEVQWAREPLDSVRLGTSGATIRASVVAESYAGDVLARVRFCRSPDCDELSMPRDPQAEVRYTIQRPLYVGARTEVSLEIAEYPTAPTAPPDCELIFTAGQPTWACVVDRCAVAGCQSGDGLSFCVDGVHACDL